MTTAIPDRFIRKDIKWVECDSDDPKDRHIARLLSLHPDKVNSSMTLEEMNEVLGIKIKGT